MGINTLGSGRATVVTREEADWEKQMLTPRARRLTHALPALRLGLRRISS
jgi:hypothetical protein